MKPIKLMLLSLIAIVLSRRPAGYCTANAAASDKAPEAATVADVAALQKQVTEQAEELAALRAAQPVPVPTPPEMPNTTALLIKGAGVDADDVHWRIRAGLSPAQAVEAAASQIAADKEAKERAAQAKKAAKK